MPPDPSIAWRADRRRGGVRGLARPVRPDPLGRRAAGPRDPPQHRRPAPAPERRPDARRALRRGRRPVVHDPVRARQHHHRRSRSCRSCPTSLARPCACSPIGRHRGRPGAGHGAGQDPARAPRRRAGADRRAAAPAVLRQRRRDAAVADPARRDVPLDRRPRAGPVALAQRPRGPGLDRPLRRPGRRRVRRVRATDAERPAEPGLEGFRRRDPPSRRQRRPRADRAGRDPGLRLRREAADGEPGATGSATTALAAAADGRGSGRSGAGSTRRSGWRTSRSTRSPSMATSARSARSPPTRATASGAGSCPTSASMRSSTDCWTRRWMAAGGFGRTPRVSRGTTRSGTTRARSGRTTTRSSPRA